MKRFVQVCVFFAGAGFATGQAFAVCTNVAEKKLKNAEAAIASAKGHSTVAAGSAATAKLNTSGSGQVSQGAVNSAGASGYYKSCATSAKMAKKSAQNCFKASGNDAAAQQRSKFYIEEAAKLASYCATKSISFAANGMNMNQAAMAMIAMSSLSGMANSGSGEGFDFSPSGFDTDTKIDPGPKVYSTRNSRDPIEEEKETFNLGQAEELTPPSDDDDEEETGAGRNVAAVVEPHKEELKPQEALELSSDQRQKMALARVEAAPEAEAGMPPFNFDDFDLGSFEDEDPLDPEFASDLGYLKATKVKELPEALKRVIRKKLQQRARTIAMQRAKQKVYDLKIDPKSCADRKWSGKECSALKSDPLLNIN